MIETDGVDLAALFFIFQIVQFAGGGITQVLGGLMALFAGRIMHDCIDNDIPVAAQSRLGRYQG